MRNTPRDDASDDAVHFSFLLPLISRSAVRHAAKIPSSPCERLIREITSGCVASRESVSSIPARKSRYARIHARNRLPDRCLCVYVRAHVCVCVRVHPIPSVLVSAYLRSLASFSPFAVRPVRSIPRRFLGTRTCVYVRVCVHARVCMHMYAMLVRSNIDGITWEAAGASAMSTFRDP